VGRLGLGRNAIGRSAILDFCNCRPEDLYPAYAKKRSAKISPIDEARTLLTPASSPIATVPVPRSLLVHQASLSPPCSLFFGGTSWCERWIDWICRDRLRAVCLFGRDECDPTR